MKIYIFSKLVSGNIQYIQTLYNGRCTQDELPTGETALLQIRLFSSINLWGTIVMCFDHTATEEY